MMAKSMGNKLGKLKCDPDSSHSARKFSRNAYINFYIRLFDQEQFKGKPASQVAQCAGKSWREMSDCEKNIYRDMALKAPKKAPRANTKRTPSRKSSRKSNAASCRKTSKPVKPKRKSIYNLVYPSSCSSEESLASSNTQDRTKSWAESCRTNGTPAKIYDQTTLYSGSDNDDCGCAPNTNKLRSIFSPASNDIASWDVPPARRVQVTPERRPLKAKRARAPKRKRSPSCEAAPPASKRKRLQKDIDRCVSIASKMSQIFTRTLNRSKSATRGSKSARRSATRCRSRTPSTTRSRSRTPRSLRRSQSCERSRAPRKSKSARRSATRRSRTPSATRCRSRTPSATRHRSRTPRSLSSRRSMTSKGSCCSTSSRAPRSKKRAKKTPSYIYSRPQQPRLAKTIAKRNISLMSLTKGKDGKVKRRGSKVKKTRSTLGNCEEVVLPARGKPIKRKRNVKSDSGSEMGCCDFGKGNMSKNKRKHN